MRNKILIFIVCCLSFGQLHAQSIKDIVKSNRGSFEKTNFKIDGIPAFILAPKNALPGNPWIWNARFPEWHTQIDSILLEKGFHVAYINTDGMLGSAKAMMIWDKFYDYLTKQKSFSTRPALEGVSRGGLFVYGWAKRNPSKVSFIYGEGPVCDFNSWPGGKGKGFGSKEEWKSLKEQYGFANDEQAKAYPDQPKDNLEGLAGFHVPILHAIGLTDSIVPNEENTFLLVNNYILLGGQATVVPMPVENPGSHGHHYDIENPKAIADIIYEYAANPKPFLPSENFIHPYGNLDHVLSRIQNKQDVTVAFLGGSITNMYGWRQKTCRYLTELFPDTKFKFINAGVPSLGSLPHAFRMQNELLELGRVDLMFIESAVNDYVNHTPETQQRRALEGVIRHAYKSNPMMDMVVMAFVDEFKLDDYKAGKIPFEVALHESLSKYYHVPFINLADEVNERIKNKEFTWEYDFKNLHPSPFGQEVYFNSIKTLLRNDLLKSGPAQKMPVVLPKPIEKLDYENGHFIPLENASGRNGFVINPSWHPTDKAGTREGYVDVPMLVGEKPGACFELAFQGTAMGISIAGGPDAGKINYSIDGKEQTPIDLFFEPHSAYLHLPQYILLADGLISKKHVLKVTIREDHNQHSKGNAMRIVHLFEN
ncbi:MAG: SGNH/GDSL hydrolase family protein [Bacteroidetes bacterium]|nr:SGNH/GDSL hydrolase family protein [Bacteroidota bacterium]